MYFIINGEAAVLNPNEDKVFAILKKTDYFGEFAVLNKNSKRTVILLLSKDFLFFFYFKI